MEDVSFVYITLLCINLTLLLLLWYRNKIELPLKFLTFIIVSSLLIEISTSTIFDYLPNNLFLYHIYNPVEFFLYSLFFASLILAKKMRRILYFLIPVYLITAIILSLFVQKINVNNSYAITIESLCIILYTLLYLRQINLYQIDNRAEKNPYFWIVIGVFLYFTGNLFIDGFLNFLLKINVDTARFYYRFSYLYKYLMGIMFMAGISMKQMTNPKFTK
ncbi:MAG: hypothetical protein M3Z92_07130 [Bacteroidota bacterium]|nr:hypothetical protein [Bacteroidota bacterium]